MKNRTHRKCLTYCMLPVSRLNNNVEWYNNSARYTAKPEIRHVAVSSSSAAAAASKFIPNEQTCGNNDKEKLPDTKPGRNLEPEGTRLKGKPNLTWEEELREGRFHFSGYGIPTCVKDGLVGKSESGTLQGTVENNKRKFVDQAKRINTISHAAFPLAFLIFNMFYWVTYKINQYENAAVCIGSTMARERRDVDETPGPV